ncbi:MAG: HAD hydrolase family protein [Eubacteriales bacterium]
MKRQKRPWIGKRIMKSVLAVFVCQMIYCLRGYHGLPIYSNIAALNSIQQERKSGIENGKNRIIATILGAAWGLLYFLLKVYVPPIEHLSYFWDSVLSALLIILVIKSAIYCKLQDSACFMCVVYLTIVISHIGDSNPYLFVFERTLDTLIGVVVAIVIDCMQIPSKKDRTTLFVSGLDEMLSEESGRIPNYIEVELNRLIEDGMQYTIATEFTLSTTIDKIKALHIQLPLICYNGALLFDVKNKDYMIVKEIEIDTTNEIHNYLAKENICCFTTTLCQETIMIYYTQFYTEIEEFVYKKHRTLTYCNYMKGELHQEARPFYLMAIGTAEQILAIYKKLKQEAFASEIHMERRRADEDQEYVCLKIYHKDASKKNMTEAYCEYAQITQHHLIGARGNFINEQEVDFVEQDALVELKRQYRKNLYQKK